MTFQQAAVTSGDLGVEAAVSWLDSNRGQASSATADSCDASIGSTVLACDQKKRGYAASVINPDTGKTWSDLWAKLVAQGIQPISLGSDAAGNVVAFVVQRMCSTQGDAGSGIDCATPPASTDCGSSKTIDSNSGAGSLGCPSQTYFRVTTQVVGPRGTMTFTQAMVAL